MKAVHCDIAVIGGGPAGTSAALEAAKSGCRVIIVERRPQIGLPVRCAEYIPAPLVGEIDLGRDYLAQAIKGMRTFLPGGAVKETGTPGYTIERDVLDLMLARASEKEGAEIWLSAKAVSLENGRMLVRRKEEYCFIHAGVIIGADGPHSSVAQWIGSPNRHLLIGAQVLASLVRPLDYTEVYFDPEIHCGYGWVFPKYEFANVGVGIKPTTSPGRVSIKKVLDDFLAKHIREQKILPPAPQRYTVGWIPAEPVKKVRQDNTLLTGDAAGHTHPITGAGIFSAVTGGKMAGKWAARAIQAKDPQLLAGYEKEARDFFEPHLKRASDRRRLMEEHWNSFDEALVRKCWVAFREYYE